MAEFEKAFQIIIGVEGGYVNDPQDPGGETKYGISKRAYPDLDIKNLELQTAKNIYFSDYWEAAGCDKLDPWDGLLVFDCAVNQGVSVAKRLWSMGRGLPEYFMAERALRYSKTRNFARFGRGWMRRLFHVSQEAEKWRSLGH
jgi:lysozyme family protein